MRQGYWRTASYCTHASGLVDADVVWSVLCGCIRACTGAVQLPSARRTRSQRQRAQRAQEDLARQCCGCTRTTTLQGSKCGSLPARAKAAGSPS